MNGNGLGEWGCMAGSQSVANTRYTLLARQVMLLTLFLVYFVRERPFEFRTMLKMN